MQQHAQRAEERGHRLGEVNPGDTLFAAHPPEVVAVLAAAREPFGTAPEVALPAQEEQSFDRRSKLFGA